VARPQRLLPVRAGSRLDLEAAVEQRLDDGRWQAVDLSDVTVTASAGGSPLAVDASAASTGIVAMSADTAGWTAGERAVEITLTDAAGAVSRAPAMAIDVIE